MVQSKYHVYILLNVFFLTEQEGPPLQMSTYAHGCLTRQNDNLPTLTSFQIHGPDLLPFDKVYLWFLQVRGINRHRSIKLELSNTTKTLPPSI